MFAVILCTAFLTVITVKTSVFAFSPNTLTVVIDAGHGGKDWGTQGLNTGIRESDLNLEYSKTLGHYFKDAGFNVVQTRISKDAVCKTERFIKLADMSERVKIIENAKADLVISIHMNNFSAQKIQRGAQVFYQAGSEASKLLSTNIQNALNKHQPKQRTELAGDYYMLRYQVIPAVIVECGFLSNLEEEKLLQTKAHRQMVCKNIFAGVLKFLSEYR